MQPKLVPLVTVCVRPGAGVPLGRSLEADAGRLVKKGATGNRKAKEGRAHVPVPSFCSLLCILGRSVGLPGLSSLYFIK